MKKLKILFIMLFVILGILFEFHYFYEILFKLDVISNISLLFITISVGGFLGYFLGNFLWIPIQAYIDIKNNEKIKIAEEI